MTSNPIIRATQERSHHTQSCILDVVEKRLSDGSFDDATVSELVADAGCSVGAFYGRFTGKAAALFDIYDRSCEQLEKQAVRLLDSDRDDSLAEQLEAFTMLVVRRTFASAGLLRSAAFRRELETESAFSERAEVFNACLLALLERCLRAREDEMAVQADRRTAIFVLAMIGGMSRDAVIHGNRMSGKRPAFGIASFGRELSYAVLRYLQVD